jgi:hypothetical protein
MKRMHRAASRRAPGAALLIALSGVLLGCGGLAARDETVRPGYERDGPPRYDRAWGVAGVFLFGDKYVDLRNGWTTVSRVDSLIWDCSTRAHWCLYGGVSFVLPKECRAFEVGDTYVLRGITMTVRAIVERRDETGVFPENEQVYIFQSDTTDFLDRPERQFIAYSQHVERLTPRFPPERMTWEMVFDIERHDIREAYWTGPRGSREPMAQCRPADEE